MPLTARRLPGIRFETQAPPSPEVLPRMDVAGFAGFAASGPIDVPVPVEDAAQFAQVFGPDAPLAWDDVHGEQAYAFLGPAVRAFFRNGGRRCWVVRVADETTAASDVFALPGLLQLDEHDRIGPALVRARSPGSWADALRVSAAVTPTLLRLRITSFAPLECEALVVSRADVVPADLIRVSFPGSRWTLLFAVGSAEPAPASPPDVPVFAGDARLERLTVRGTHPLWLGAVELAGAGPGTITYLGPHGEERSAGASMEPQSPPGPLRLELSVGPSEAPVAGSVVRGDFATGGVWIEVADVEASRTGAAVLRGAAFEVSRVTPVPQPEQAADSLVERLELELLVEDRHGGVARLGGLALASGHPRFVGALPDDAALYAEPSAPAAGSLWADAAQPRCPLAGPESPPVLLFPLASSAAVHWLGAVQDDAADRVRDGLSGFGAGLFVDDGLRDVPHQTLLETADFIRYQSPRPRSLRGIHSLLGVEEVTLVSAPDAVHRQWEGRDAWRGVDPDPPGPAPQPDWSQFLDCATHVPAAPVLTIRDDGPDAFVLAWSETDAARPEYELQESLDPDFGGALTLYRGPARELWLFGRPEGSTLYYQVRASAGGTTGGWSNRVVHRSGTPRLYLDEPADYSPEPLREIQLALLRMCAARGDLLAVLALPEHYRERAAVAYVRSLKRDESPIYGYGALYHPWLFSADPAQPTVIRRVPPDGAAAGVLAARANERGAWIAPANELLRDVVELDPALGPDTYSLFQDAQVNLVRHEPGGFLWLSADTLAEDEDVRPIGVRRLLQLLRRAALLHGPQYAFEPNDDVFRRTIQRGFEQLLSFMFSLGAFAGRTVDEAFQVNAGSPPNTRRSVEAGRLIVELQVAPSRPLAFLTVRLLRSGEGGFQLEAP